MSEPVGMVYVLSAVLAVAVWLICAGHLAPRSVMERERHRLEWKQVHDDQAKRCRHREAVPVESGGETVAHLCLTCDEQLPAEWRP